MHIIQSLTTSRWMGSTNARDIGTSYIIYALGSGLAGTAASVIIRMELASPGNGVLSGNYQLYNSIITIHGLLMIFFLVMPALMGGFANYLLPVQLGSPDMAIVPKEEMKVMGSYTKDTLGYYLAGLIEGDGYLSINNKDKLMIGITFHIWDTPLADKWILYFKGGYIVKRPQNSIELRFTSKQSLIDVVMLLNGKFRTPKIDQLHKALLFINRKYNLNLPLLPIDSSSIDSNGWWAGFLDADGGFYIRYNLTSRLCAFRLEQRMIYPVTKQSYGPCLRKICSFLEVPLHVRERKTVKRSYYVIRVENQTSLKILCSYLDQFPLLTHKYLNYKDWWLAFHIILRKEHFSDKGSLDILNCKNKMNSKRTLFTWFHL